MVSQEGSRDETLEEIIRSLLEKAANKMNKHDKMGLTRSTREVLAKNLVRLRKARGLTQQELADKTDLSKSFIGGMENARMNVSLDNLESVGRILGVETFILLIPDDDP